MTSRKPIQIPSDFALCEDGSMWKRVPSSGGMLDPFIPAHWEKVDSIPSDEEYEKQCEERKELWERYMSKMEEKLSKSMR
jgi:hypothetical protein